MCGIVGLFNMRNSEDITLTEHDRSFLIKYLLAKLTLETETRGKDATGYFALFQNGESIGLKHGVNAFKFCTKDWDDGNEKFNFKNHLNLVEAYHNEISPISSILAHCRAKTIGTETDNNNNHPIHVENIVGIHNGCLSNHYKIASTIRDDITRIGLVDSEMIFQLLWLLTNKGQDKFDNSLVKKLTERLDGSFASICLDKNDPDSVFFVRDTRPIEFVYIKEAGFLIALSEKKFFDNAMVGYKWLGFYGVDLPDITSEAYVLPDDTGFTLKLDKTIEKGASIKDIIGETEKTERTDTEWKSTTTYSCSSTNTVSKHTNVVDRYTEREEALKRADDKKKKEIGVNTPAIPESVTRGCGIKNSKTEIPADIQKVANDLRKKVTNNIVLETANWNRTEKKFEVLYKNAADVYKKDMDNTFLDKFTIFKGQKMLATKLGIDELEIDSLTAAQLANRVSKIVYEEHVKNRDIQIKALKEETAKQLLKGERTRKHIINLRGIVNVLVTALCPIYKDGQIEMNKIEKESMATLWKFLYCNSKHKLQNTTLGNFIFKLADNTDEQLTNNT